MRPLQSLNFLFSSFVESQFVRRHLSFIMNGGNDRARVRACVCIRVCSSRLYASVVNFSCKFYISHKYITATVRLPRIRIREHRRRLGLFVTSFVLIVSHVGLPAAETGYQGVTRELSRCTRTWSPT